MDWRSVSAENYKKLCMLLQVQPTKVMRTAPGKKNQKSQWTASQIRVQINARSRHITASTVQRRLYQSSLYGQIALMKPLLGKVTSREDFFFWSGNTKSGHSTSGFLYFGLRSPYLRCLVPPAMSLCNTEKLDRWVLHAWFPLWRLAEEEEVRWWWGSFSSDTVRTLFKIGGALTLQRHVIHSGGTPNTPASCRGHLTKENSDEGLRKMAWPPQSPNLNPL